VAVRVVLELLGERIAVRVGAGLLVLVQRVRAVVQGPGRARGVGLAVTDRVVGVGHQVIHRLFSSSPDSALSSRPRRYRRDRKTSAYLSGRKTTRTPVAAPKPHSDFPRRT